MDRRTTIKILLPVMVSLTASVFCAMAYIELRRFEFAHAHEIALLGLKKLGAKHLSDKITAQIASFLPDEGENTSEIQPNNQTVEDNTWGQLKETLQKSPVRKKKEVLVQTTWPVHGQVMRRFRQENSDGILISAVPGSIIRVTEKGMVIYSGSELEDYGNLVLISHGEGIVTAYAYLDSVFVNRGDQLEVGQKIGTVGASGSKSQEENVLHFELRKNSKPVDPSHYLREVMDKNNTDKDRLFLNSRKASIPPNLIEQIQSGLRAYGFDDVDPDGMMGQATATAIQRFQLEYGMKINGEPSIAVLNKLKEIGAYRSSTVPLGVISEVGTALSVRGYFHQKPSSVLSPALVLAVKKFQTDHNLESDGQINVRLLTQILLSSTTPPISQIAPTPSDLIARIQSGLRTYGYDDIDLDGKMDRQTASAIQRFQLDYGMKITGEPSVAVLNKLKDIGAYASN